MKTQNTNKLNFNKASITELNDQHLNEINGGAPSTPLCFAITFVTAVLSYITNDMNDSN